MSLQRLRTELRGFIPDGFPIVTVVLMGLCGLFYLLTIQLSSSLAISVGEEAVTKPYQLALLKYGAVETGRIAMGEWWRTVSSVFLHANIPHLVMNALGLWTVGTVAEERFGHARTLVVYVVAGTLGMVASVLWHRHVFVVGASGAIFGLMGCIIAHAYRHGRQAGTRELKQRFVPWLLFALVIGFAVDGVDNAAHLGGLVAGGACGVFLGEKTIVRRVRWVWELFAAATILAVAFAFYAATKIPLVTG